MDMTNKTEEIKVLVEPKTKEELRTLAKQNGLKMSSYSRMKLKEDLKEAQA